MILPKNTKEIIESYMIPRNDRSASLDSMLLALYMQVSRFLCWNRVKAYGEKGLEYPMLYGFNFAPSGAYKDEVLNSLTTVIADCLKQQKELKLNRHVFLMKEYYKQLGEKKGTEKKDYAKDYKPQRFSNVFSSGSDVALQKDRKACEVAELGAIHFTQDEFIDYYSKKDSTSDSLFRMMKSIYSKGNSEPNKILGEWRESVVDTPITMLLYGSADTLHNEPIHLMKLRNILETGIAKRAFVLYDNQTKRAQRTLDQEFDDERLYTDSIPYIKDIFNKMFKAIKILDHETSYSLDYETQTIKVSKKVNEIRNTYKNKCYGQLDIINNSIIKKDMQDRFWRAFRLSACIAVLEHPKDLTIKKEDYEFAIELTERWGKQLKDFLEGEKKDSMDIIWDYIRDNPNCGKTQIRKVAKTKSPKEIDQVIKNIQTMADERGMILIEKKGSGLARYHSILETSELPEHFDIISKGLEARKEKELRSSFGDTVDEVKNLLNA